MDLIEKFLKYVSIDTTSNSEKIDTPSTTGQIELANLLFKELQDLNVDMLHYDKEHCYIYAKLKGNENLPKIGFISHLDTSEAACGKNIQPNVLFNYNGGDIALSNEVILSASAYPDLKNHVGKTLITTNGKTLLGSDDKAGIAEIMSMLECFSTSKIDHGDIFVCFTPDEEVGLGTLHFDQNYFKPDFAYTVDGSNLGEFSYENFNAASAKINIKGISTHCGYAKDVMINAGRIATIINSLLVDEIPENTSDYQGFFHLEKIEGNVNNASMSYLIRDFDKNNFENRKTLLKTIVEQLNKQYGGCIELVIEDSYYNMKEAIDEHADLINNTINSIANIGIEPQIIPIRGGTDGTAISFMGIPCPNIGTGGHNFHSVYEYICLEDMEKTRDILVSIVKQFSKEKGKEKIK